ncbi:MAG TPA: ammonium transporter [Mycobacteriales bacterium]|nr:ammonium transporter [Mycobacteriales bacterium]HVU62118.1 ammonium transporter [Mycobacteriales bacterium]
MNAGDTAWVLGSAGLVLFMTPGLALFYGGMIRSKNVLAMIIANFATIAVVSIVWALLAYSIAFGPDSAGGLFGNLHFAGLAHPEQQPAGFGLTVPPLAFAAFQMMFAIITAALLTGTVAERAKFGGFLAFAVLWVVFVYAPIAHWVFSPTGWLFKKGVLDFAGGNVVEIDSGASALAIAFVIGRRKGWPREAIAPHSLPFTMLGAGILWFGWFGFNAGSALASGALASQALVGTQLAASAGLLAWLLLEKMRTGKATTLGAASGAVAGLVAITPAAGFVNSMGAIVVGALGGAVSLFACSFKFRGGYDDSLDVVGVHGAAGIVGTLLVGVFATKAVNPSITYDGLIHGHAHLLGVQALAVIVTIAWAFTVTYIIATVVQRTIGLRVDDAHELEGLDTALHAESAYDFGNARAVRFGS